MTERTDIILGRIALSSGMITEGQLEELIANVKAGRLAKAIEDELQEGGILTEDQAGTLRRLRRDLSSEDIGERSLFGRVALEKGFITEDQLLEARKAQEEMESRGDFKPLGEVMVNLGLLTSKQAERIAGMQEKVQLVCGVCSKSYMVLKGHEDTSRCPHCAVKLATPGEAAEAAKRTEEAAAMPVPPTPVKAEAKAGSPVGQVIAGCEVVGMLGKGSMGEVFRARHVALGREVAIKMLPAKGKEQLMVKRLLFEARAIAKLEHPNIVQVFDAGLQSGYLFLVMQLVEGQPLDEILKECGNLMEDQAIGITKDVLRGLANAHSKGIIHRDLKPGNIMISPDGKAKIMDFGLARDVEHTDEVAGMIIGTPYYMAPEQWLGQKTDERSDLYALGIILYAMTTGKKPFDSTEISELMHMHLKKGAVSPKSIIPSMSESLVAIIRKAMSKSPAKRYQTAADFLNDLDRYTRGEEPAALGQFMKLNKCGFCEALNPENATRCKVCGEPLRATQQDVGLSIMPRADEIKCPACGGFAKAGARACPKCNRAFCTRCHKRLAMLQGYCEYCVSVLRKQSGQQPPGKK